MKLKLVRKVLFGCLSLLLCGCLFFGLRVFGASDNGNNNQTEEENQNGEENGGDRSIYTPSTYNIISSSNYNLGTMGIYMLVSSDMLNASNYPYNLFYMNSTSDFCLRLTNFGLFVYLSNAQITNSQNIDIEDMKEGDLIFISMSGSGSYANPRVYYYTLINGQWSFVKELTTGSLSLNKRNLFINYSIYSKVALDSTFNPDEGLISSNITTTTITDTVYPNDSGSTWFIYKELNNLWYSQGQNPLLFTLYGSNHTFNYFLDYTNHKILQYVDDSPDPFSIDYNSNDILGLKYNGIGNIEMISYKIDQDVNIDNEINSSTYFTQNTSTLNTLSNIEKIEFRNGFMGKYTPGSNTTIPNYYLADVLSRINYLQYNYGYQEGLEGENVFSPVWNILSGVFSVVASVLSIELVPHITIGVFFLIPLFFAVLGLILWIWKGKN